MTLFWVSSFDHKNKMLNEKPAGKATEMKAKENSEVAQTRVGRCTKSTAEGKVSLIILTNLQFILIFWFIIL